MIEITDKYLKRFNKLFNNSSLEEILDWIFSNLFPDVAMISSFQVSGVVLIHFIRKIKNDFPIYFIDTGFHFPETLEFVERLKKEWNLNVITIKPKYSKKEQSEKFGELLYKKNPDLCCLINKVQPMQELKESLNISAWISAIRKDQSKPRSNYKMFMKDKDGYFRVHPLIHWTKNKIWNSIYTEKLPFHPLYEQGYTSIGCFPPSCTKKITLGTHERAGRWSSSKKDECGLHLELYSEDDER